MLETVSCYSPVFSSNVGALTTSGNIVQIGGFTLGSLQSKISAQPFPTKPCPASTPFLSKGKCIGCPTGHFYNLQARRCYKPKPATNISFLVSSGKFVPVGNHDDQRVSTPVLLATPSQLSLVLVLPQSSTEPTASVAQREPLSY